MAVVKEAETEEDSVVAATVVVEKEEAMAEGRRR